MPRRAISLGSSLALAALCGSACARRVPAELQTPPHSNVVTSADPSRSAIFLYRVEGGIVVIDLGWWQADDALARGLAELAATTDDVIGVFLTHSHRDHVGAWRSVRHAPFHLAASEVALLFGEERHGGWVPGWAEKVRRSDLPRAGEIGTRTFSSDTFMVFGGDTLRAFLVPGHTAGSAAYLFRGSLHAGDAIAHTWMRGFRHALGPYSTDEGEARRSLSSLRERLIPFYVRTVCTSHLKCSDATEEFWIDVLGERDARASDAER